MRDSIVDRSTHQLQNVSIIHWEVIVLVFIDRLLLILVRMIYLASFPGSRSRREKRRDPMKTAKELSKRHVS